MFATIKLYMCYIRNKVVETYVILVLTKLKWKVIAYYIFKTLNSTCDGFKHCEILI